MSLSDQERLDRRSYFSHGVEEYDALRPGYPKALLDTIAQQTGLAKASKVLEIGCGTGKASRYFAERGYTLHGLDIAEAMIAFCSNAFRDYPNLSFEVAAFEDWQAPEVYDLVVAATSFHWLPPDKAHRLVAQVLIDGGWLACFSNAHPIPMTGFHETVQDVYSRVLNAPNPNEGPRTEEAIAALKHDFETSSHYQHVKVFSFAWQESYPIETYLRLLNSYSFQGTLGQQVKAELFAGIADHAQRYYQGVVDKAYLSVLFLAQTH